MRLLVLGHTSAASTKVTEEVVSLLSDEEYEEVVHVDAWEDLDHAGDDKGVAAKVLRVSTDWIQHPEEHGEGRYEPSRNVEIVKIEDYSSHDVRSLFCSLAIRESINYQVADDDSRSCARHHTCAVSRKFDYTSCAAKPAAAIAAGRTCGPKHRALKPARPSAGQKHVPCHFLRR